MKITTVLIAVVVLLFGTVAAADARKKQRAVSSKPAAPVLALDACQRGESATTIAVKTTRKARKVRASVNGKRARLHTRRRAAGKMYWMFRVDQAKDTHRVKVIAVGKRIKRIVRTRVAAAPCYGG